MSDCISTCLSQKSSSNTNQSASEHFGLCAETFFKNSGRMSENNILRFIDVAGMYANTLFSLTNIPRRPIDPFRYRIGDMIQ